MSNLAAVVERERAEAVAEALTAEGVYDDTRSVAPHGDGVALPVTTPPIETDVRGVVRVDLPTRERGLRDLLAARGWSDAELARAPGSWAVVGSCVLVDAPDEPFPDQAAVGEALLELHGAADTVLVAQGVSGVRREPEVTVLAGTGDTETIHTEHGTRYALDLAEVMFSPGNKTERARMGGVVTEGERVFDMFAGVGYFTLPMARAGATVTAAEINPTAYRYLVENAVLNGVEERVRALRADCRDVEANADRVVMGYYDAPDYLESAVAALEAGGILHVHAAVPEPELWARPVDRIRAVAGEVTVLDRRIVKSHAPGVQHVVVDARMDSAPPI
ncbi:class I SAM-dependent methyltransferase family protein [Halosegnis sp.]|uniref:class I SAM-dependent methyltransferase n=1 Tax=Halosegnis sp. TaxID=2864959 RepID=UPI0035D47600